MVNRSLVRRKAIMRLMGRFLPAMLLALLAEVITFAVSYLQTAVYNALGIKLITASQLISTEAIDAYFKELLADRFAVVKMLAVFAGGLLVSFIIAAPLRFGTLKWHVAVVKGNPKQIGYALNEYGSFKAIGRSLWIYVYTGLHYLKWGALIFAAPLGMAVGGSLIYGQGKEGLAGMLMSFGVVTAIACAVLFIFVTNRLFLAPYIYAEGDISAVAATRESKERMRGQSGGLLVFQLSLLPFVLLSYLLCYGAGTIIVAPFASMCYATYADEIMTGGGSAEEENIEYTVE
ncbi:MAG: hypothetical protein J5756_02065 [Clostridia bacterium]|nr:hypothetical protein [Clostridia bacterium]